MMTPETFLKELDDALSQYRFDDIGPLIEQIDPSQFTSKQVKRTLQGLRRKRCFSEMEKAACLFFFAGHEDPVVRRQWAQALLDQNRVAQALTTLELMAPQVENDPEEGPEVRGLIGRAYKQLYVNEHNKENLIKAIHAYQPGWHDRVGDYRWHGINLVALLNRAAKEGVDPQIEDQPHEIAHSILQEIEQLETLDVWAYSTAMEAAITLGDEQAALKWAQRYALNPAADAFELASTIRQMKEVWKLEEEDLGKKLLPVLEFELLHREDGTLRPTSLAVEDDTGFEAIYGNEAYIYMQWLDTMYQCCTSVARVCCSTTGQPWGTGFLLKGSVLCKKWGDEVVFMTNSHVISNYPADEAPLREGEGSAEFTRLPLHPKIELGELLFSSPKIELDVSILRIKVPADIWPLKMARYLPVISEEHDKPQRIYVIGHPNGGELAVSLYDNTLHAYQDNCYVHYRSPTEGGHSGSPVFTRQWNLLAIHHRARHELHVNEGILLECIKKAVPT